MLLLAGRFEGIDERVIEARGLAEVSIGDYVLSGGELAAMVLIDAVVRLLPGVVGQSASLTEESFEAGLLEYPHYTRPREWEGRPIPDVLLSGDHKRIAEWRRARGGAPHRRASPRPRAHPPREAGRVGRARAASKPRSLPAILDSTFPPARRFHDIAAPPPAERHPALPTGAYDIAPRASATPAARPRDRYNCGPDPGQSPFQPL